MADGQRLLSEGRAEDALELVSEGIEAHRSYVPGWMVMARIQAALGDVEEAAGWLRAVLAASPGHRSAAELLEELELSAPGPEEPEAAPVSAAGRPAGGSRDGSEGAPASAPVEGSARPSALGDGGRSPEVLSGSAHGEEGDVAPSGEAAPLGAPPLVVAPMEAEEAPRRAEEPGPGPGWPTVTSLPEAGGPDPWAPLAEDDEGGGEDTDPQVELASETLGDLYARQGDVAAARRMYRRVLERTGAASARAKLAALEGEEEAGDAHRGEDPRVSALQRFLDAMTTPDGG